MTHSKLRALAERAFKWSALTTAGRFGLQLVAQILLARLLGPDNYGVYGIGMVVLTFAGFISGNAFSYSLMLRKELTEEDVRFAFTWQAAGGLACALGMYLGAPALAEFFGDPRVEPMVHWLSVACVLQSLAGPSTCLLQRDLNFRALGLIQIAAYGLGYLVVGVPLALAGYGPQALAAACVVQALVTVVANFAARPHSLRPLFRHAHGADTMDTGRTVFMTNLINWLLANLDRAVIGRMLNAHAVGLYSVAYNIASIPYVLLIGALQPAFLSAGARLQDHPQQLAQAWRSLLACTLVFLVPAAIAMALLAGDLVQVLYGPAWSEAGWLMAVMFLCLPAWACLGLSTPVLWNTGRKQQEVLLQLPVLALAVPAWFLLSPWGIRAVALVSAGVILLRAGMVVAAGLRAVQLEPRAVLAPVLRGALLGALFGAVVEAARLAAAASFDSPLLSLLAGSFSALALALAIVAVRPQLLGSDARSVLSRFVPSVGAGWPSTAPEARP